MIRDSSVMEIKEIFYAVEKLSSEVILNAYLTHSFCERDAQDLTCRSPKRKTEFLSSIDNLFLYHPLLHSTHQILFHPLLRPANLNLDQLSFTQYLI